MSARIRYARSDGVNVAYEVTGDGPFDLVLVAGFFSRLEVDREHPASAHLFERLASFARLIRFDKRGTGLSPIAWSACRTSRRGWTMFVQSWTPRKVARRPCSDTRRAAR